MLEQEERGTLFLSAVINSWHCLEIEKKYLSASEPHTKGF
jgi:hypothetical protein